MVPGRKISETESSGILSAGVLKREVQEVEKANKAAAQVRKSVGKDTPQWRVFCGARSPCGRNQPPRC